jgi:cystathionine beta-lyase
VDCRALGLDKRGLEELIRNKAKLWLDAGYIFGESGTGWQRFNAACPRSILEDAMLRLDQALNG